MVSEQTPRFSLTLAEYTDVNPIPYVKSIHPGALHIPGSTTQHETTQLCEDHKDTIRIFRESLDVENISCQKIVASVEPKYIDILRIPVINAITADIPTILIYIFWAYGSITPELLAETATAVKYIHYSTTEPLVTIFQAIEDIGLMS